MKDIHVYIAARHGDRAIQAAGGTRSLSKWLNTVVLPVFLGTLDPSDPNVSRESLQRENARLRGEIAGLRYALSLRPGGSYVLNESADNGSNHTPYEPVESPIYRRTG